MPQDRCIVTPTSLHPQRRSVLGAGYRHFERALRLLDELGMDDAVTAQARLLASLAERLGERGLAAQWRSFIAGRPGAWTYFDGTVAAASRNRDGLAARAAGDPAKAAAAHLGALRWYRDAGLPTGVAFSESCLGSLAADGDGLSAAALGQAEATR